MKLDPFDDNGEESLSFDERKLLWVLQNFKIVNFNGRKYDFPITTLALAGYETIHMWNATVMIIVEKLQAKEVYKKYKTKRLEDLNQIDLIELTALRPSLKVCAGRIHAPKMQDLPIKPGTYLTKDQVIITRYYLNNDLDNTGLLYTSHLPIIEIREKTGYKYNVDLRSHSDAQMAEALIGAEIRRIKGIKHVPRPVMDPELKLRYKAPAYVKFKTGLFNWVLDKFEGATYTIDFNGDVVMPEGMGEKEFVITVNTSKYQFGLGGLHSQEKCRGSVADDKYFIADTDVTSYYPKIILNTGLFPANLGTDFILVYDGVVVDRITAKQAGDIITAECLKIVVNGTFGKLGNMWSILYSPNLLIQTTITGQLSIAMLIEEFELNGIEVISVNTDGIVVKCEHTKRELFNHIVSEWRKQSGLETEETGLKALYSKDINNYIAVYEKPQKGKLFKTKGLYAETAPKKNAVNEICIDALKEYLANGTPVEKTILECKKITRFTSMRFVDGGAVKGDKYLGKIVRWYYAKDEQGEIISAKTGNKVARTDNAKPCMDLPKESLLAGAERRHKVRWLACPKPSPGWRVETLPDSCLEGKLRPWNEGRRYSCS